MMEYIVMPTAIIKLKINKTGGHQSFSGGLPHFPITPSPFPPFSSVPSEKVFFYCLPIGRPFTGTHSPTIYRAFLISFHLISSLLFYSCLFPPSRVWGRTGTPQCNYSSTQRPDTVYKGVFPFSHLFPSHVNVETAEFLLQH